jgi:hypothetical protein
MDFLTEVQWSPYVVGWYRHIKLVYMADFQ